MEDLSFLSSGELYLLELLSHGTLAHLSLPDFTLLRNSTPTSGIMFSRKPRNP